LLGDGLGMARRQRLVRGRQRRGGGDRDDPATVRALARLRDLLALLGTDLQPPAARAREADEAITIAGPGGRPRPAYPDPRPALRAHDPLRPVGRHAQALAALAVDPRHQPTRPLLQMDMHTCKQACKISDPGGVATSLPAPWRSW